MGRLSSEAMNMKQNEIHRQQITHDVASYLASGGTIQQLAVDASAAQHEPPRRKRRDYIKHLKRSDPSHPSHSD
jgi:hypothetical protein